ncbi:MAG: hypothetical protein M3Y73_07645 [Actinomycetota bacterium]|nr:hypothetical protein [Actinomycetota bacterium]
MASRNDFNEMSEIYVVEFDGTVSDYVGPALHSFARHRGPPADEGDVMPDLPSRPDLGQLRRQAKELLRAAQRDDTRAVARLHAVSDHLILSSALLAVAREYGFASWAKLKAEVTRREILDTRDVTRLTALLAQHPELAVQPMLHWCDHPRGATAELRRHAALRHLAGHLARRARHRGYRPETA